MPVPQSGTCLGKLTAGQYTSLTFQPKLTFRVTNGWANYLDMSGLYLLQPPGAQPPGNSIVGSFVGLETSVAPEAFDCKSRASGVRTTPSAIAAGRDCFYRDCQLCGALRLSGNVFDREVKSARAVFCRPVVGEHLLAGRHFRDRSQGRRERTGDRVSPMW